MSDQQITDSHEGLKQWIFSDRQRHPVVVGNGISHDIVEKCSVIAVGNGRIDRRPAHISIRQHIDVHKGVCQHLIAVVRIRGKICRRLSADVLLSRIIRLQVSFPDRNAQLLKRLVKGRGVADVHTETDAERYQQHGQITASPSLFRKCLGPLFPSPSLPAHPDRQNCAVCQHQRVSIRKKAPAQSRAPEPERNA